MTKFEFQKLFSKLKLNSSVPHCVLIQGSNESNRSETAKLIAQIILCTEKNLELFPCDKCSSCIKFKANAHADLTVISGEGKTQIISVDKVRQMKEDAHIIPIESERKVFIISNAQNMTVQAQNATLKIFEEPPNGVHFIMTCGKADDLLETIRSRTQIFTLDGNDKNYDENEPYKLAKKIINGIIYSRYNELLLISGNFVKDKNLFNEVLLQLEVMVRDIIKYNFTKNISENISDINIELCKNEQMLKLYDIICDMLAKTTVNIYQSLFVTKFCSLILNL